MSDKVVIGKCTFCTYEGSVTEVNQWSFACPDCMIFVKSRQHPEIPPVTPLAKSAPAN